MRLGYFAKAKKARIRISSNEHLEDLVFNNGVAGVKEALNYLEGLRTMLATGAGSDNHQLTVKWDGAPAIICGIDPEDGKFFVGTKSVFSKIPKLIKKPSQADKLYPEQPDLAAKLRTAYRLLSKLGIGGVLQGDFMFDSTSKTVHDINGQAVISFTPNTITYAAPMDSDIGKRIGQAEFGIIFHTEYDGPSLPEMQAKFGADVSGLNRTPKVWFDDASYKDFTGVASLTPEENVDMVQSINRIVGTLNKVHEKDFSAVLDNKEISQYFKPYVNNLVREGSLGSDPLAFLKGFVVFYENKMRVEIGKLKSGPNSKIAKDRMAKIEANKTFVDRHMNAMLGIIAIFYGLVNIKLKMVKKLKGIESIGTFLKSGTGYTITSPEGFVAIGKLGGAVKLVDRLEFSRTNFLATKTWLKT